MRPQPILRYQMDNSAPLAGSFRVSNEQSVVTVYFRPGCPYCVSLRRSLRRAKVDFEEVNIWEHPEATTIVRTIADGNETVPTVLVGAIPLVNPSAQEILAVLNGTGPSVCRRSRRLGRLLRCYAVATVIAASFAVDALGHSDLSWALDGVAVAVYLVFPGVQR